MGSSSPLSRGENKKTYLKPPTRFSLVRQFQVSYIQKLFRNPSKNNKVKNQEIRLQAGRPSTPSTKPSPPTAFPNPVFPPILCFFGRGGFRLWLCLYRWRFRSNLATLCLQDHCGSTFMASQPLVFLCY